jgi:hypothetical protein
MKNILFLLSLLFAFSCYGQKKKSVSSKSVVSFAKIENLQVEIKNENFQLTLLDKGKEVDALVIKKAGDMVPIATKITPFTANGTRLYLVTWTEKTNTKTDLKTEDKLVVFSYVYNLATKKEVFFNTQLTNNIVEKVFLDRNKTASETQTRIRREGYEFSLNPDGTLTQKTAKQLNKWKYDLATDSFIDAKKK